MNNASLASADPGPAAHAFDPPAAVAPAKLRPSDLIRLASTIHSLLQSLGWSIRPDTSPSAASAAGRTNEVGIPSAVDVGNAQASDVECGIPDGTAAALSELENAASEERAIAGAESVPTSFAGKAASTVELEQLRSELFEAHNALEAERRNRDAERRQWFEAAVDRLVERGRIAPSDRDELMEAGRAGGHRPALLAPFERLPAGTAFPTRNSATTLARPDEPATDVAMSEERARQLARCFAD